MKPFLASMRVRLSVSSPASSYFITSSRVVSCDIIPSAPPLTCVGGSSSSSVSNTSASFPPFVSSGIIASAVPCRLLSLLRYRFSLRRFSSSDSRRSLRYVPVYPLTSSSCSLNACMAPYMPASRPAQRFTLPHASLHYAPPARRKSLAKRRRHISLITTVLTPGIFQGDQLCCHDCAVGRPGR